MKQPIGLARVGSQAPFLAALLIGATVQAQPTQAWRLVRDVEVSQAMSVGTEFTQVRAIVPMGPLTAVVVEGRPAGIGVYGANGQLLRPIGRIGRGPGEYELPHEVGLLGDTVWVTEVGTRRTSMFSSRGDLLATVAWQTATEAPTQGGGVMVEGLLPNGFAWGGRDNSPDALGDPPKSRTLFRLTREGRLVDTMVTVPTSGAMFGIRRDDGGISFGRQPFTDATLALCGVGHAACLLIDRRVASERRRGSFRVTAIRADGDTLWSKSYGYEPRALEKGIRDSVFRSYESRLLRSGATPQQIRDAIFLPAYRPPISAAFAGADGFLWLARETGAATIEYWVLDAAGHHVATARSPAKVSIRAVSGNYVWAVETDNDDVQRVARYRIVR